MIKVNQLAKYVGQRSISLKVNVQANIKHIGLTALPGQLKWSVNIRKNI